MAPTDERSSALYDTWHRQTYGDADADTLEPTAPWHLMARKHIGDVGGQRVLEIGCGPGQFARWLSEQGADVVAGDFSSAACEIARRTCGDAVDVRQLDAQDLIGPLGPETFNVVVCLETLEHVLDHNRALREIVGVTRPGGRILVSTPNYLSLVGVFRATLRVAGRRFTEMGQPVNNVMIGYARTWKLRRLGCRIDAVEGAVHHLPIPGTNRIVSFPFMERHAFRYVARHVLVAATKVEDPATIRA